MHNFELWIDESGSFSDDDILLLSNGRTKNPSLVGGVLVEKEDIDEDAFEEHFGNVQAHSCEIQNTNDKEAQLDRDLQFILDHHGHFVIFENSERITCRADRELYLRVFASGLVQLLNRLSNEWGDYSLNIFIAKRTPGGLHGTTITQDEYMYYIEKYIDESKSNSTYCVGNNTVVDLTIGRATSNHTQGEYKLDISDSVCNAYLTYSRGKRLIKETYGSYIFSVNEDKALNRIEANRKNGDFLSALMEYAKNYTILKRTKEFEKIADDMSKCSYRVNRYTLRAFTKSIVAFLSGFSDFEKNEALVKDLLDKKIPYLREKNIPYSTELTFELYLFLIDMFIREGDVQAAHKYFPKLKETAKGFKWNIEYFDKLWQLVEKEALLYINRLEYDKAVEILDKAIGGFEDIITAFMNNDFLNDNLAPNSSEYMGDALCMKVYAEMFIQRERPELFNQLIKDVDYALEQYWEYGAKERNLQYKSHIYLEHGDYEEALRWLLSTVLEEVPKRVEDKDIKAYLSRTHKEDSLSRMYYLMYYVEIMSDAMMGGDLELAGKLYEHWEKDKELKKYIISNVPEQIHAIKHAENVNLYGHVDDILNVISPRTIERMYHPTEIVCWKLGSYYACCGNLKEAIKWYDFATQVCKTDTNYIMLKFVNLAVEMEKIYYLIIEKQNYFKDKREIIKICNELRKEHLSGKMEAIVDCCMSAFDGNEEDTADKCRECSRMIAY